MAYDKAIGIDLGTTNSCVGIMNNTDSEIVLYREKILGVSTTPSCVWYDARENKIIVGRLAYGRRGSRPEPVVSIKRKMGTMVLTPLGKADRIPKNLPGELAQILTEDKEQRLERYLNRIKDPNPIRQEAIRAESRKDPPELWIFDQNARLASYLKSISDSDEKQRIKENPPLLWLPEEISALILAEERQQIQETLAQSKDMADYQVNRALITVPAYFDSLQVEATKEAGRIAGLQVVELLPEPTAAAKYYCWKHNIQEGIFMIFDLGGGTFDVSIVRHTAGTFFEPLGISGNKTLGGDDMDAELAEHIRQRLILEDPSRKLDLDYKREEDSSILNGLKYMAEGAKKALTDHPETWLRNTNSIKDLDGNSVNVEMIIKRETSNDLFQPILEECIPKCWEALARASKRSDVSLKDIDYIFLVGGSTHVPLVKDMVQKYFCMGEVRPTISEEDRAAILEDIEGDDDEETQDLRSRADTMIKTGERAKCKKPIKERPDLCVALGAAIKAAEYGVKTYGIHFDGPWGTRESHINVSGRLLDAIVEDSDLDGAIIQICCEAQGYEDEIPLSSHRTFVFQKVPLHPSVDNLFQVCVIGSNGQTIHEELLMIRQDPNYKTLGGAGGTSLSKAIYIDVIHQGKLRKEVLVSSGTTLPAKEHQDLEVPNPNAGVIEFRIYQARRLLKTIRAIIDPTLNPGTSIDFSFSISEDHMMVADYQIGDNPPESAVVEPPEPEKPPTPEAVSAIQKKIEDSLEYKSEAQKKKFQIRVEKAREKIEKARQQGDEPRMIDSFNSLQELDQELSQVTPELEPPWHEFQEILRQCQIWVDEVEKIKPNYPVNEARQNLRELGEAGKEAYNEKNEQEYKDYYDRIRTIGRGLLEELKDKIHIPPPPPPHVAARQKINELIKDCTDLQKRAEALASRFEGRVLTPNTGETPEENQGHAQQCSQCEKELRSCVNNLEGLKSKCPENAQEVLSQCNSIEAKIEVHRQVLDTKERILSGQAAPETTPWKKE